MAGRPRPSDRVLYRVLWHVRRGLVREVEGRYRSALRWCRAAGLVDGDALTPAGLEALRTLARLRPALLFYTSVGDLVADLRRGSRRALWVLREAGLTPAELERLHLALVEVGQGRHQGQE